jgi:RHS repeat-associated protein
VEHHPIVYLWDGGQLTDIYDTVTAPDNAVTLDVFAHHTKLQYESFFSPRTTIRPWRSRPASRLKAVDVTSVSMDDGTRAQVRRYRLHYAGENGHANHDHLMSVTAQGRCAVSSANSRGPGTVLEDATGKLPDSLGQCDSYPTVTFGYSTVPQIDTAIHRVIPSQPSVAKSYCSIPAIDPYLDCHAPGACPEFTHIDFDRCTPIDGGAQRCACYPSIEMEAQFSDVNGDSLPDMLMPLGTFPQPNDPQRLCLNDGHDSFSCERTISYATVPEFDVASRAYGDFLGTGSTDMLVMAGAASGEAYDAASHEQQYIAYGAAPVGTTSNFQWVAQGVGNWSWRPANAAIDLTTLSEQVFATADFDGDGLSDLLTWRFGVTGQRKRDVFAGLKVYGASLTRRTSAGFIIPFNRAEAPRDPTRLTAQFRGDNIPVWATMKSTATTDANQRDFDHKDPAKSAPFEFADMNGDGIPDLVAPGITVQYWPGFGDGTFGNVACDVADPAGGQPSCRNAGVNGDPVIMHTEARFDPITTRVTFHDVTGDGYADMIVSTPDFLTVYQNVHGDTLEGYTYVRGEALAELWGEHATVSFADINGSGVDDVVIAKQGAGYVDLLGGAKPGLLTSVTNTDGLAVSVDYTTVAELDRAAAPPWSKHSAQNIHVVKRMVTSNGLAAPHLIAKTVNYDYRDPVFDPRSHEFRGFETVATARPDDGVVPGSETTQTFLVGQCVHAPGAPCAPTVDNPFDALRGIVANTVTRTPSAAAFVGATLSSTHSVYQIRRVAAGSDGRAVRLVYPEQVDSFVYDSTVPASGGAASLDDVHATDPGDQILSHPSPVPADGSAGVAHLRSSRVLDDWGRTTKTTAYGRIDRDVDPSIVSTTEWYTPPGAVLGLISSVRRTNVGAGDASGNLIDAGRTKTYDYSAAGDLTDTTATLSGTVALTRRVPAPASASKDGSVLVEHIERDRFFGNPMSTTRPNGRSESVAYDALHQFVILRNVSTGTAETGFDNLVTQYTYDVGLGKVIAQIEPSGALTTTTYDGIGRVLKLTKPSASLLGVTTDSVTTRYWQANFDGVRRVQTTTVVDDGPTTVESWTLLDALGTTLATARTADPGAGDGGPWVIGGLTDRSASGKVARSYVSMFGDGTFLREIPSPGGRPFVAYTYDEHGRVRRTTALDGGPGSETVYHLLTELTYDAEDLTYGGSHANTPSVVTYDGHHRKVQTVEQSVHPAPSSVTNRYSYLPTGELSTLTRTYDRGPYVTGAPQATYTRELFYDSLGRLVRNVEPNSQYSSDKSKVWRYAYDDAGDTVATNDARDCGENLYYDAAGRKLAEDFVPCEAWHAEYTAPSLATGAGTEAYYRYDTGEPDQAPDSDAAVWKGKLVSVRDRGTHTRMGYDARGRVARISRRLAKPGLPDPSLDSRYSSYWFDRTTQYDETDRVRTATTGADVDALLEGGESRVTTEYTARGLVKIVGSSYGDLLTGLTYDEDGSPLTRTRGDAAATTTTMKYTFSAAKRMTRATVTRGTAPAAWTNPPAGYVAPELRELTLSDTVYGYDRVGNPTSVSDLAPPGAWPTGAKPVSRTMEYDDRYRLTKVTYDSGNDAFVDPMPATAMASSAAPKARVQWQAFEYDGVGNTIRTTDDASVFLDRSLGKIANGATDTATGQVMVPNQLAQVGDKAKRADGIGAATYDKAGNMWTLASIHPGAICVGGRPCVASFRYDWDEVGRLAHATRTDTGVRPLAADLTFAYDADGNRVLTSNAITGTFNATIFPSLRLQATTWDGASSTYVRSATTETVYLTGGARVVYSETDMPSLSSGKRHVFFTLGDALGSTSMVIDKETSEVVERRTYQAYGAVESDYRPERWRGFREPFGFTGKEEDLETGLVYFGARYYSPVIGRWASPDPLTIHKVGADLNPYAYVSGRAYAATDPNGLEEKAAPAEARVATGNSVSEPEQPYLECSDTDCVEPPGGFGIFGWSSVSVSSPGIVGVEVELVGIDGFDKNGPYQSVVLAGGLDAHLGEGGAAVMGGVEATVSFSRASVETIAIAEITVGSPGGGVVGAFRQSSGEWGFYAGVHGIEGILGAGIGFTVPASWNAALDAGVGKMLHFDIPKPKTPLVELNY